MKSSKMIVAIVCCSLSSCIILSFGKANATTLNFDDIILNNGLYRDVPIPVGYGGLTWDTNQPDFEGSNLGAWWVSDNNYYATAHSGLNYLFNGYGPQNLGFSFSSAVNFVDAWFWLYNNGGANPSPIELIGYIGNTPTYYSSMLALSQTPQKLSITGNGITRVEVHGSQSAWYTMDDLTYSAPEPSALVLFGYGLLGLFGLRKIFHR